LTGGLAAAMYEDHFGLRQAPFSLTPDTGFFFRNDAHVEALQVLRVALDAGEGFIKVTGEVGTGKTLLCRLLLNGLDEQWVTAWVPNPYLDPDALRRAIADELRVALGPTPRQHTLVKKLQERLIELAASGKRVAVVIDEAQALSDESLEALRLLSNLETETRKLLHVVLFGQPELDERLAQPQLRQLRHESDSAIGSSPWMPTASRSTCNIDWRWRATTAGRCSRRVRCAASTARVAASRAS